MRVWNAPKRWKMMNYIHFNNFRFLPPALSISTTLFCFKMTAIEQGLLAIICKLLLLFQMYCKKVQCLADNFHVTIRFVLHLQSNGTLRGLETFVQRLWQIRFYPHVNQGLRRKQQITRIKRTTRTRSC